MFDRHGCGEFATAHESVDQALEVHSAFVSRRDTVMIDATSVRDDVVAWDGIRTAVGFGLLAMCKHDPSANAADVEADSGQIKLQRGASEQGGSKSWSLDSQ